MNMATRNRAPWSRTKAFMRVTAEASVLALWALIFWASMMLAGAMEPVEPETRCFDTAVKSERYCRTQGDW